jgi:hypothetical protein
LCVEVACIHDWVFEVDRKINYENIFQFLLDNCLQLTNKNWCEQSESSIFILLIFQINKIKICRKPQATAQFLLVYVLRTLSNKN